MHLFFLYCKQTSKFNFFAHPLLDETLHFLFVFMKLRIGTGLSVTRYYWFKRFSILSFLSERAGKYPSISVSEHLKAMKQAISLEC